jgi:hypothetical protein
MLLSLLRTQFKDKTPLKITHSSLSDKDMYGLVSDEQQF